jgi:hypothetical protein
VLNVICGAVRGCLGIILNWLVRLNKATWPSSRVDAGGRLGGGGSGESHRDLGVSKLRSMIMVSCLLYI